MPQQVRDAAADPVGGPAEGNGEQEVDRRTAERQQWEVLHVEGEPLLQDQVEEPVAHADEAERRGREEDPAEGGNVEEPQGFPQCGRGPARRACRPGLAAGDEREEDQYTQQAEAEADDEDRVVGVDGRPQDGEGDERSEHGARGVHGPVHSEGAAEIPLVAAQRDQGVPRRCPHTFADPVRGESGGEGGGGTAREEQTELADGGQRVSASGDELVSLPAVGGVPAGESDEGGDTVVEAVEEAELEWAESQAQDEVEGQYGGDHLGRDVGDEADRAERDDGAGEAPSAGGPYG